MTDTDRKAEENLQRVDAELDVLGRRLLTAEMKHQRECDGRPSTHDAGHHDPLLEALIREHPEMAVKFWNKGE